MVFSFFPYGVILNEVKDLLAAVKLLLSEL